MSKTGALSLLFGEKGKNICEKVLGLSRRFPRLVPESILRELASFLTQCRDSLYERHSALFLIKIFFALKRLRQKVGRDFRLRILPIAPSECGIALGFTSHKNYKFFSEQHFFKSIQQLIPGTLSLSNTYLSYESEELSCFYIEIKKMRGGAFFKEDLKKLKDQLETSLTQLLESADLNLIFPGNEEEVFKSIRHLNREIRQVNDQPQVMISFVEYFKETLKFLVIVTRVVKPNTPSIVELAKQLPFLVHFSLENVLSTGMVRKKYPKEAAIFTLEINCTFFSRPHNAVNLRSARNYIVKALHCMLGAFRDYNGGLLLKENEQVIAIKSALEAKGIVSLYLDKLFYNIKPISRRVLMTVAGGVEMARAFEETFKKTIPNQASSILNHFAFPQLYMALIKTKNREWKKTLPPYVMSQMAQVAYTSFEKDEFLYLCFFHQLSSENGLLQVVEQAIKELPAPLQEKKVVRLNFQSGGPTTLNPRLAADIHSHTLSNLLFEGLTRIDSHGKVILGAAKEINISPCGTRYSFILRESFWSSGEELTAYNFEKSWKKALMENTIGYPFPDFFSPILHAKKARNREVSLDQVGIRALHSKLLEVTLEAPCSYFLELISTPPFFPLYDHSEEPKEFNGPFAVVNWKAGEAIHLSQNPFWWNSQEIKIGGIQISSIKDSQEALRLFKKGELDFIGDPISPLSPSHLKERAIQQQLVYKSGSRVFWLHCNLQMFPLHNRNLRQALSLSLDRQLLAEKVFIDHEPHSSPFPPQYSQTEFEKVNRAKAKSLFTNALKELDLTFDSFPEIEILQSDLAFEEPLIQELQKQWQEVLGIRLKPVKLSWNEFSARLERGNFQLAGLFRRDLFSHPLFYLSFFKSYPHNPHRLDLDVYQNLLATYEKSENCLKKLKGLEKILIEERPVIPLVNQRFFALTSKRIKGVTWIPNGCLDLTEVSIDEEYH